MPKELLTLAPGVAYLPGGSNLGLLGNEEQRLAVAVDAGLDGDAARGLYRAAEAAGWSIVALFITHAHADHFGGARWLRDRTGAEVVATSLEAAVIANPMLEPLYLWGGGAPPAELRGKFLLGTACPVDRIVTAGEMVELAGLSCRVEPLPGHSLAQAGLGWGPALFAGDAVFPPAVLAKHRLPVYAGPRQAKATLERLAGLGYRWVIPGHGTALAGEELVSACAASAAALDRLEEAVREVLASGPQTADDLLGLVAAKLGAELAGLSQVALARLTLQGLLGELADAGEVRAAVSGGRLLWEKLP